MKKIIARILFAGLLVVAVVLASIQLPRAYYPTVEIEAAERTDAQDGALTISFLFDSRPTLKSCEGLTGNIARVVLEACRQCRVKNIQCEGALDEFQRRLLSDAPLAVPSGRMANGVVVFTAAVPELALVACKTAEAQSAVRSNPIKCFAANTLRPKPAPPSIVSLWSAAMLMAALAAAWLTGWLIIRYEHLHAHLSHDHVGSGPQKYHTQPTPRIGGLAVMVGLLVAGGVMLFVDTLPNEREFGLLLFAGIPAFLGGLVEDLTKQVGVVKRLLLTMLSGAVAAWLLGAVLNRLDIPGVDQALQWLPLAVIFTSFAVGGVANATNIIDGYNGLAGGFAVIVLAALAYVAAQVGDSLVFNTALALAGAVLGFLVWNWPGGKIFLGDGGAYLLGFLLAELSVLLVSHNPEVSTWFPLLLLIYPVFETVFSIYRRKFKLGLSPGAPDNKHMHQLIHAKLVLSQIPADNIFRQVETNSRVAKYFWCIAGALATLGAICWQSGYFLASFAAAFCWIYVFSYRRLGNRH
ncbi:MAG: glycosyltransferase [Rhodocyclaceae bacterium]|nr:glycosyltransferase [Rhodocyclaceae bacterium]